MVPYDGRYVSLAGLGVITLNDLNFRNYRVSENGVFRLCSGAHGNV